MPTFILLLALTSLTASEPPVRVTLAVASSLLENGFSTVEASALMQRAETLLYRHLGREFRLRRIVSWPHQTRLGTPHELLTRLMADVPRGDGDIVVGMAPSLGRPGGDSDGAASYEEAYAVVVTSGAGREMDRLLAHELAHIFGALHSRDRSSLMHASVTGTEIDPLNRRAIELHRRRRFRSVTFPLQGEQLQQARSIYMAMRERGATDAEVMVARLDIEEGRYEEAIASLQPRSVKEPPDEEAAVLLGIAYRRSRLYDDALRIYDRILATQPNARIEYNRAIALTHQGDLVGAIAGYRRALELAPQFAPAMANLGRLLSERGRVTEAIELLEGALQLDPENENIRATLGFAWYAAGDLERARRFTDEVLGQEPGSATALNTLGKLHEARCATNPMPAPCLAAVEAFERAIEVDPNYGEAMLNLAQIRVDAGELEAAVSLAQRALRVRSHWGQARLILARALHRQGRWSEAESELTAAVREDAGLAQAHAELGYVYLLSERLADAAVATRKALELDPGLASAWLNLGVIASRRGDLNEAIQNYQRALEKNPRYGDAHLNLGHAQLSRANVQEAKASYERALQLGMRSGVLHNNLAVIYFRQGSLDQAWKHVAEARALGSEPHPGFIAELEQKSRPLGQ